MPVGYLLAFGLAETAVRGETAACGEATAFDVSAAYTDRSFLDGFSFVLIRRISSFCLDNCNFIYFDKNLRRTFRNNTNDTLLPIKTQSSSTKSGQRQFFNLVGHSFEIDTRRHRFASIASFFFYAIFLRIVGELRVSEYLRIAHVLRGTAYSFASHALHMKWPID